MVLTLVHDQLPGVTVVGVRGELDLLTAGSLGDRLQQLWRPGDQLIVDLTKTAFIDCSGIRALLLAGRRVHQRGGLIRLAAPRPGPAKIIRLAELDTVLPVHPSVRHAIGAAYNDPGRPDLRVQDRWDGRRP